jgi:hypothetical protein
VSSRWQGYAIGAATVKIASSRWTCIVLAHGVAYHFSCSERRSFIIEPARLKLKRFPTCVVIGISLKVAADHGK